MIWAGEDPAWHCGDSHCQVRTNAEDGQTGEGADAGPGASPPAPEKGDEGAGEETGASRLTLGEPAKAPAPGEPCDIDDLPDCLVGGVHQAHCRHAGKPVGPGVNP